MTPLRQLADSGTKLIAPLASFLKAVRQNLFLCHISVLSMRPVMVDYAWDVWYNVYMNQKKTFSNKEQGLPEMFRPLLWSFRWTDIDVEKDKEDIILNAVNEGTLDHWRWLMGAYRKDEIKKILGRRLITEFHPESLRLAQVIFGKFSPRYAR
jgi:hypothetical protein